MTQLLSSAHVTHHPRAVEAAGNNSSTVNAIAPVLDVRDSPCASGFLHSNLLISFPFPYTSPHLILRNSNDCSRDHTHNVQIAHYTLHCDTLISCALEIFLLTYLLTRPYDNGLENAATAHVEVCTVGHATTGQSQELTLLHIAVQKTENLHRV